MRISHLVLVSLILLLFSCGQRDRRDIVVKEFPIKYVLHGEKIGLKEVYPGATVYLIESLLILINTGNEGNQIHFYSRETYEYFDSYCMVGRGPREINNPGAGSIDQKNQIKL